MNKEILNPKHWSFQATDNCRCSSCRSSQSCVCVLCRNQRLCSLRHWNTFSWLIAFFMSKIIISWAPVGITDRLTPWRVRSLQCVCMLSLKTFCVKSVSRNNNALIIKAEQFRSFKDEWIFFLVHTLAAPPAFVARGLCDWSTDANFSLAALFQCTCLFFCLSFISGKMKWFFFPETVDFVLIATHFAHH